MNVILVIIGLLLVSFLSTKLVEYGEQHSWFLGENHYHNKK